MSDTPHPPESRRHRASGTDGWTLDVLELQPIGEPRATVIAGHAMMVDRRTIYRSDRPTLASTLVASGFRVLVPDLRGHGESGPTASEGGDWRYRDLVDDTAAFLQLAREVDPQRPIALVGHSLFAHTSLAYLGQHPEAPVAALAMVGAHIWEHAWQGSLRGFLFRRGLTALIWAVSQVIGRVPVRRLGVGSADESRGYWSDFRRYLRQGRWRDGSVDYVANMARVRCPVLHVVSENDKGAPPDEALRWSRGLGARREVLRLGGPERASSGPLPEGLRGLVPGHMALVTDPTSQPVWRYIADWLGRNVGS
jgi:predicted alpha/beta hydrolase